MSKRKNVEDVEPISGVESYCEMNKLLGELQPAKKLLKNLLKAEEQVKEDKTNSLENDSEGEDVEEEDEEDGEENVSDDDDVVEDDEKEEELTSDDPFSIHFEKNLDQNLVKDFKEKKKMTKLTSLESENFVVEEYGFVEKSVLTDHLVDLETPVGFGDAIIKEKLLANWPLVNKAKKSKENLTKLQRDLLKPIASYQDLYYSERSFQNGEEIRRLYALHAVNHVLKTRNKIIKNNSKLHHAAEVGIEIEDLRDQGITRPKVLIVVPFKDSCLKIVNIIRKLLFGVEKKVQVMNKKRFQKEFSSEEPSYKGFKPDDFKNMFEGNIDDGFRVGLALSKNTMKLYTQFYSSDIIIASPLGLRTLIGGKGEKQDFDFLSSIELLIIDQADVFLMQNWEHVITLMDHVNRTPKSTHDTDISRVRMWAVNEWSHYYRQSLMFSSFPTPEINGIFNKYFQNFAGKTKMIVANVPGTVQQVSSDIPQIFYKINADSYVTLADKRFDYFINQILPGLTKNPTGVTIYIPSYYDFVRVRNYMKKEEMNFVQISEYTEKGYSSHARTMFKAGRKQIMLFTGRFFFFFRYRITGIKHLVFYDIPQYPQFYPEIVNFISINKETVSPSCMTLFSQYDALKLQGVVGTDRMKKMMSGKKAVHMIVTGQ